MGYYTDYKLKIEAPSEVLQEINKYATENKEEIISDLIEGNLDSCKWYEHETDMREFSKNFPETLFILNGEGEESEDIWIKYFKNGKMQMCEAQITFEDFDPKKLK